MPNVTMRNVSRLLLMAATVLLAQCMERDALAPGGENAPAAPRAASMVSCTGSTTKQTVTCSSDLGGTFLRVGSHMASANSAFNLSAAVLPDGIIVGGQNTFVTLASSNIVAAGGVFSFDVTVQNLIPQAMGTNDGMTPTAEGVRVFFHQLPTVTAGAGTISVGNADGTETFTSTGQQYYQYNGILDPNEVSSAKNWQFNFTGTINFEFKVFVWAPVQYPDGWVIVTPPSDQLEMPSDPDVQLSGNVVDAVGRSITSPPAIVWSSSDDAVATVDNTGLVTAQGAGSATITATADTYVGESEITVIGDVDHFVVEAAAGGAIGTQAAGAAFNIKITAQDAANQTVTDFTGTVDLTSTPAGLSVTSGAFAAGVLASQSVTIASGGNYTITATRTAGSAAGTSNAFDVTAPAGAVADEVSGTSAPNDPYHTPLNTALTIPDGAQDLLANDNRGFPLANVSHFGGIQCNNGDGTGNFSPVTDAGVTANTAGTTIANLNGIGGCTGGSLTVNADGTLTFTPASNYTGLFRFQYRITNSTGTSDAQVTLAVGVRPAASDDTYPTNLLGNVPINTATSSNFNVTTNDAGDVKVLALGTASNGTAVLAAGGTFTFTPDAGYTGPASFTYTLRNGFGTTASTPVSMTVSGIAWFIDKAAGAGDGRLATPFNDLSTAFAAATKPLANQPIFLYSNASAYTGGVTLLNGQLLVGQGTTGASFAAVMGVTWPADAGTQPSIGGTNPSVTGGLTLGSGNTLRGFNITSGTLSGTNFGTLTLNGDLGINTTSQAINLNNGTISGGFAAVTSTGGTNAVALNTVNSASPVTLTGPFSGASGATLLISGGNIPLTVTGNVTQANNAALLSVAGGHTGTLTFNTGTVQASNGTGLQFDNADGTYNFNGTTTLNGGDAGIDILNGSGGSFTFGTGTSITHGGATNQAFFHSGSDANVSYSGSITKAGGTGWLVDIFNQSGGTITFQTGTLSAANVGGGILFNNADGSVNFNGTTTLSGASRYRVGGGSSGAISFGTGATHTSPVTNSAFEVVSGNGATNVTFAGTLTSTANTHTKLADIQGVSSGTVTLSGALSATNGAQGISVSNNSGGTIEFSHTTKTLTTNANAAVTLSSNTGATVNFSNGGLAITTTSGAGFGASGGGTVNVTGAGNIVSSGSGTAVSINGTTIGSDGVTFQSVTHAGGANGIFLSNTGNTGGSFTVTGTGAVGTGGSITNTAGADGATSGVGIYLSSARNIVLNWMNLSGHANHGLYATGVRGTFTLSRLRFTGNNGTSNSGTFNESAVSLNNHGGTTRITGTRMDGGAMNGLRIDNSASTSPALDSLVLESDTVATMQGSPADVRGSAMLVSLFDGTVAARINNNRVLAWYGNGIHFLVQGTSSGTARIFSNFADNTVGALAGAGGIWVGGCSFTFNISSNTVRHTNGTAISADMSTNSSSGCATETLQGVIDSNIIGVSGDANSGSGTGIGIFVGARSGTTTINITNNTLRQINGSADGAITVRTGDAALYGGSGTVNVTMSGNNIQESGTTVNNAQHGILITHGVTSSAPGDAHQGCYNILNNSITNFTSGSANNRIRVNQRFDTTSRWPGYTGAQLGVTSQTDMAAYLLGRNTASTSTNANTSTGGFLNTSPAGSACPQPATLP